MGSIDSWIKFGFFMAGSFWLAALSFATFWLRLIVTRNESAGDREKGRHHKANSHAAGRDHSPRLSGEDDRARE